eukprot:TRINITY_DN5047_c0_g2_i1.p1 TRINITY_DN5047_c0_g2~~TRINITY_DN5047_c0_g2_i1.p1  ORF type:complete len:384 (+),score=60.72 TRINITY_DN5047_c0_g2_i1:98-1249(+)
MSYRVSYKNTFLAFGSEQEESECVPAQRTGSPVGSPRSRSLDSASKGRPSGESDVVVEQLQKLNELLCPTPSASASEADQDAPLSPGRPLPHVASASTMADDWSEANEDTGERNQVEFDMMIEENPGGSAWLGGRERSVDETPPEQQEQLPHPQRADCYSTRPTSFTYSVSTVESSEVRGGTVPLRNVSPKSGAREVLQRSESSRGGSRAGSPREEDTTDCATGSLPGSRRSREYRHGEVPKTVDFAVEYQNAQHDQPPTTMMIRNIPNRYTQRELMKELTELGFAGKFDFLYMPVDKGTKSNVGYFFVNFADPVYAEQCIEVFKDYRFQKHCKGSGKVAAISAAHIQGLEANLAHYEKSAVNITKLKQRRPMVLTCVPRTSE